MSKSIVISEGALQKSNTKELLKLSNAVKSKRGKVGETGLLKNNVFYKILRNGFLLF